MKTRILVLTLVSALAALFAVALIHPAQKPAERLTASPAAETTSATLASAPAAPTSTQPAAPAVTKLSHKSRDFSTSQTHISEATTTTTPMSATTTPGMPPEPTHELEVRILDAGDNPDEFGGIYCPDVCEDIVVGDNGIAGHEHMPTTTTVAQ